MIFLKNRSGLELFLYICQIATELKIMKTFIRRIRLGIIVPLAVLAAGAVSCETAGPEPVRVICPPGEKVAIRIAIPDPDSGVRTRTELGRDGEGTDGRLAIEWSDGDGFQLWAAEASETGLPALGKFVYQASSIDDVIQGSDYSRLFSGEMARLSGESYTYYAIYPESVARSDDEMTAYYDIPAVQNGEYGSGGTVKDLMWAATGSGQRPLDMYIRNELDLNFKHLLHALKVRIPANPFGGGPVSAVRVVFPRPVAGRLAIDVASGAAALSDQAEQYSGITVEFKEPKPAGEAFWIFLAPGDTGGGQVQFTATDGTEYTYPVSTGALRDLAAGHITPVTLNLGGIRQKKQFVFTVDPDSNLGEPVTAVSSVVFPEGYGLPGLEMVRTVAGADLVPAGDGYSFTMFEDLYEQFLRESSEVEMTVESEHAWNVTGMCRVRSSGDGCVIESPYLYFEDFSGITMSYEYNTEHSTSDSSNPDPIKLDGYGLPRWTGTRVGMSAGTGIRIQSRVETGLWVPNRMYGRTESAPIDNLKPGVSVKVKVTYDYSGARYNAAGGSSGNVLMSFGYTGYEATKEGIAAATALDHPLIEDEAIGLDATGNGLHYGNTPHSRSVEIPSCDADTRLCWKVYNDRAGAFGANGVYWLYIDNVRVSIVP